MFFFKKKTSCISQLKTPQCISIGFGITSKFLTMVNTVRHELPLPTSLALSQTAPSSSSRPQTPSGFEVSAQPTRRLLALLVLENVPEVHFLGEALRRVCPPIPVTIRSYSFQHLSQHLFNFYYLSPNGDIESLRKRNCVYLFSPFFSSRA